jgi:hypothetical protein
VKDSPASTWGVYLMIHKDDHDQHVVGNNIDTGTKT